MPTFISNSNKLAYELRISNKDSSQMLLLQLLDHRLHLWSNKETILAIKRDLPSLKWKIKYSRKDIVRQSNKDAARELTKAQMLAGMESTSSTDEETLEALNVLPLLFKNKATQSWAKSVIQFGKEQTQLNFNQTPRQFGSKLNKVCKYARQHQQPKQSSHTEELHILSKWHALMDNESTDDNDIQAFIGQYEEYINEVINSSQIAYQGRLIKAFTHAGKDKYVLVNLMAKREQELRENK